MSRSLKDKSKDSFDKTTKKAVKQNAKDKSSYNNSSNDIKNLHISLPRVVIFLIIIAISCGFGFGFKSPIESLLNKDSTVKTIGDISTIDDNGLSVHFIDVGQGDAIAIRFPNNQTMLVDAGPQKSSSSLIEYLKTKFFKSGEVVFDYLLLTHSDEDHCGGMAEVCNNFVVNTIYRPYIYCKYTKNGAILFDETNGISKSKYICPTLVYYNTIKAFNGEIDNNGESAKVIWTDLNTINTTYRIYGTGFAVDFYAPTQNYITESAGTIANDFSPIMVLTYNSKKIMLTGDASTTSETDAMNRTTLPNVDLLKVGHHGSKTSSGEAFLQQVKPQIAVISVGANNSYKHPTTETLNRLLNIGSSIYRTDINGTIVANVTSDLTAQLNIYALGKPTTSYIHVEYLIAGIVVLSATICFGKKINI